MWIWYWSDHHQQIACLPTYELPFNFSLRRSGDPVHSAGAFFINGHHLLSVNMQQQSQMHTASSYSQNGPELVDKRSQPARQILAKLALHTAYSRPRHTRCDCCQVSAELPMTYLTPRPLVTSVLNIRPGTTCFAASKLNCMILFCKLLDHYLAAVLCPRDCICPGISQHESVSWVPCRVC